MRKNLIILILAAAAAAPAGGEGLSLRQAVDLALSQNRSIQASRHKLEGAQAGVMAARGNLVPQLAASASAMRLNSLISMDPMSYTVPVFDGDTVTSYYVPMQSATISQDKIGYTYSGKLSATWPVYTGGRIWQGYQISRLSRDAAQQELDTTVAGVTLAVTEAYYGLVLARQGLAVTQEAVASIEKHVARVQALYDKGMVSRLDLLRAQVQLSNLQPQLYRMQNAAELAARSLNLVLGRDQAAPVAPSDSLTYQPVAADSAGLVAHALASRPELKMMELGRRIAGKSRLISWSGYQPSVVLMADYSTSKGAGFSGDEAWQKNWDVGIAASWTLFDGLGTVGRIRQATAGARQLEVTRAQVEDYVRLDVTANYLTLKASEKAILSQQHAVEQAQEAYRMSQAKYESGQATNLDVLDANLALSQARSNSIQAVHDYLVALARLEKAVGRPVR
ncbi:MAG: TolC family protein [Candidatus Edwardsbacteria bacterium]|jgi:outer membrane protein TolC|nr:TolC family protein [Candidatus Edwardsbacteria bacterium]